MNLKKIATKMHVEALHSKKHTSYRRLGRGLQIRLVYRKNDIVLILWRSSVKPSEAEVNVCLKNFFPANHSNLEKRVDIENAIYLKMPR